MGNLPWAAGLFAGEGHAGTVKRNSGSRNPVQYLYLYLRIDMLDIRAMRLFAETVGYPQTLRVVTYWRDQTRMKAEFNVTHLNAGRVMNLLLPHMQDCDKRDQMEAALVRARWVPHASGLWGPPEPRSTHRVSV